MSFHDVRFPVDVSFGASGGPERRTEIITLESGHEVRNQPWAHARRRYDAGLGLRSLADLEGVIAFFEARGGALHAFRWKDWTDWRSAPAGREIEATDQEIGTGDGLETVFALSKTYSSGGVSYRRPIAKPVAGSVRVAVDAVELPPEAFTVDHGTGLVTLSEAPQEGATVSAGFTFDVPVRFDTDRIVTSLGAFEAGEVPSVPLVEVRV